MPESEVRHITHGGVRRGRRAPWSGSAITRETKADVGVGRPRRTPRYEFFNEFSIQHTGCLVTRLGISTRRYWPCSYWHKRAELGVGPEQSTVTAMGNDAIPNHWGMERMRQKGETRSSYSQVLPAAAQSDSGVKETDRRAVVGPR
jgi:hypothetical protein